MIYLETDSFKKVCSILILDKLETTQIVCLDLLGLPLNIFFFFFAICCSKVRLACTSLENPVCLYFESNMSEQLFVPSCPKANLWLNLQVRVLRVPRVI